ncbi:MAG: PaaI family thioesterase [Parasphingorhabdus sp.]|uniref:PaaI family thioesterase n=1 Tax=Parasphingorhabdus sp. TaxID=2709688 RepID=UPI00329712C7
MTEQVFDPIANIQMMMDNAPVSDGQEPDMSMAPPFVRGMNLSGLKFTRVSAGEFDMVWTIGQHLTHFDGMVQGGIVNVIADTGQSFAYSTTSQKPEAFSTADFATRFFRPMKAGEIIDVRSQVVNRSRRLGVVETRFINQQTEKLCALVVGSWMIVNRDFGPDPSK